MALYVCRLLRSVFVAAVLGSAAFAFSGPSWTNASQAADVAGLSWGDFVAPDADRAKATKIDAAATNTALSLNLQLEDVEAKAEGETTQATSSFGGQFLVSQPAKLPLENVTVTISGLIIKTAGSDAVIEVKVGDYKTRFAWGADEVKSERFTQRSTGAIANGKINSPFDIAAVISASKPTASGAALVSIDTITVEVGNALVSDVLPSSTKKPALPSAAPALVVSENQL